MLLTQAAAFFTAATPSERVTAANALADRTIGTRGFFEWDSGPEPWGNESVDLDGERTEDILWRSRTWSSTAMVWLTD